MTPKAHRRIAAALAIMVWAILPLSASAQAQGSRKKVIRLEEITVEGRIHKPQAFYILPRSNLDYAALERTESFLDKIEESVEKEPF